jgi:mannose-6-phosphate isomerase-like protein (cupin superfamily)
MSAGQTNTDDIGSAEMLLPGSPLSKTLAYFTDDLGFRIEMIYPADAPRVATISGYGVRLRLDAGLDGDPGNILLKCSNPEKHSRRCVAPNGTTVEFAPAEEPVALPPIQSSLLVMGEGDGDGFGEGRAGMQYRDLIPDRFGGRFIASHIRIVDGGPVADYVHHHHILFQMIFCVRGWVRVLYEDQGEAMLLEAGDCFLQPPHIRHRVLESSDNMEVVEISCPAEHETCVDHNMELPTPTLDSDREFGGQRFVFHKGQDAIWSSWRNTGFEQQDTGINKATNGIVSAVVVRSSGEIDSAPLAHNGEIDFLFVMNGSASLHCGDAESQPLNKNASAAIPAGMACELTDVSADFKMLEVFVPSQ